MKRLGLFVVGKHRYLRLIHGNPQNQIIFHIKPASRFHFHDDKSHLFSSKYLQQLYIVHSVIGYMEISMLQLFPTHDKKELITMFVAQELLQFSMKSLSCKMYSISIVLGRGPQVEKPYFRLKNIMPCWFWAPNLHTVPYLTLLAQSRLVMINIYSRCNLLACAFLLRMFWMKMMEQYRT